MKTTATLKAQPGEAVIVKVSSENLNMLHLNKIEKVEIAIRGAIMNIPVHIT